MSLAADIPLWLVAVLAVAAVVTAYMAYASPPVPLSVARRAGLTGLRLAALLLLLVLLLRPVSTEPGADPGTAVAVLLDDSRSMRLADGLPQRRIDRAATLVRETIVPSLGGRFDVEVVTLDGSPAPAAPDAVEPAAPRTDLAAALQAVAKRYEGRDLAGVVVVSDGGDTGGAGMQRVIDGSLGPVYAVGLGPAGGFPDLEVAALTAGEAAVAGSVVELAADVVARGGDLEPIPVRLLAGGRLIETRRVTPAAPGTPLRTVFRVAPDADAATLYTVEIPPVEGEPVVENNRRAVLVQPPDRVRRLLLVEGAPGHEHSFLKRVWLADPGLAIDAVVRKGLNERGEQTFYVQGDPARTAALASGYPESREALFEYDAVVFANVEPAFFQPSQLEMTAAFVADRGGGLLLLGATTLESEGLAGSAVEAAIPLELSDRGRPVTAAGRFANRHRLLLTADGEAHPIMRLGPDAGETRTGWEAVPALAGSVSLGGPRPGASVLALVGRPEGGASPLIAVQRYGRGRSMVFAGEAAWRWKMMLPSDSRTYDLFWRQAARWLTAETPARLALSAPAGRSPGEQIEIDIRVHDAGYRPRPDAPPVVEVTTPAGDVRTVDAVLADRRAGRYAARFRAGDAGVYRIDARSGPGADRPTSSTRWVLVGGVDPEFADPRPDDALLRRMADGSGGAYLTASEAGELGGLLGAAAVAPPPVTRELWHGVWALLLLVGLLAAEWSLRRAWGMR